MYGQNYPADVVRGRLELDGQMTALFTDATISEYFDDETEIALNLWAPVSQAAAADFMGFTMSRVKIYSDEKDDPDQHITQTLRFSALLNTAGGSGTAHEESTLVVQDSQA